MRITDGEGNALSSVHLGLSDAEAAELSQALAALQSADKGWHERISDPTDEREITVYREDDESAAV